MKLGNPTHTETRWTRTRSKAFLISTNLPPVTFLPLQGGGQEGDGIDSVPDSTHPHPNPPLEGEGDFVSGRSVQIRKAFDHATPQRTQRETVTKLNTRVEQCCNAIYWGRFKIIHVASLRSLREAIYSFSLPGFARELFSGICHVILLLLLALSLCQPAQAQETPALNDFARMMPLTLSGQGALHELPLPAEVYAWSERSDLGDLAVFNAAGEIVPFTLLRPLPLKTAPAGRELPLFPLSGPARTLPGGISMQLRTDGQGAIVNLKTAPGSSLIRAATSYIVDASALYQAVSGFDLAVTPRENGYVGTLRVETSDDLQQWRQHTSGALASLSAGERLLSRERIEFTAVKARYFRLNICPELGAPRLDSVTARLETPRTERRESASYLLTPVKGKNGEYLARTGGQMPVDRLRLVFPDENSLAGVTFLSRPDDKFPWIERGSGTFYRLRRDAGVVESGALEIAPTTDRQWLVRLHRSGGRSGGALPRLEAGWQPHRLIFAARGETPFRLAYGSSRIGQDSLRDDSLAAGLETWEKQLIKPLPAKAGAALESGGRQALRPRIPAATWRKAQLWVALLSGVLLLAGMAWKLAREMGLADIRKNQSKN